MGHHSNQLLNGARCIYNLKGVRVDEPKKGIYIQNRKKLIVK